VSSSVRSSPLLVGLVPDFLRPAELIMTAGSGCRTGSRRLRVFVERTAAWLTTSGRSLNPARPDGAHCKNLYTPLCAVGTPRSHARRPVPLTLVHPGHRRQARPARVLHDHATGQFFLLISGYTYGRESGPKEACAMLTTQAQMEALVKAYGASFTAAERPCSISYLN
jgi:hypothetical protein